MYYYIAIDNGKSDNDSLDTHDLIWTSFDNVEKTLSYDSLRKIWLQAKEIVLKIMDNKNQATKQKNSQIVNFFV